MINKLKTLVKTVFGKKDVAPPVVETPIVEEVKPPEPKWEVKIVPVETTKPKEVPAKRGPRPQPKQQVKSTQNQPKNTQAKKPAVNQGTVPKSPATAKQTPKKTAAEVLKTVNKPKENQHGDKSRHSK
jgi:hypothetical protein